MTIERKVKIFIAMSLDGFIATKNDTLEWLENVEGEGDSGYSKFYETVDTVVMGRRTYDWIKEHVEDTFPYEDKQCYVFSRQQRENKEQVIFTSENSTEFVQQLRQQEGKDIWLVGGGELISTFMRNRVVDEVIITVAPVILGEGIPLFNDSTLSESMRLKGVTKYNQFVELHFEL